MAASDFFKNLWGTLNSYFHIGGPSGPRWKNNSSVMEARNSDDSAFVKVRGLAAVDANDLVTWKQFVTKMGGAIVKRQADTSAALPVNTTVAGMIVVTTAGTGAVVGDLLYDNGLNTGNMEIIPATEGQLILVTDALTGGTIRLSADTIYMLDTDGGNVWRGQISEASGALRTMRVPTATAAGVNSDEKIRANMRVVRADIIITTPYSAGATMNIGWDTDTDGILPFASLPADCLRTTGHYSFEFDVPFKNADALVLISIGGTPGAGVGVVWIYFAAPLA